MRHCQHLSELLKRFGVTYPSFLVPAALDTYIIFFFFFSLHAPARLENNNVGDKGARALAETLKSNVTLEKLECVAW